MHQNDHYTIPLFAVGTELQPGGLCVHHLRRQRGRHRPAAVRPRRLLRGLRAAAGGEHRQVPLVQGKDRVLRHGGGGGAAGTVSRLKEW